MITIQNETICGIPTLHVVKAGKEEAEKLPTIFYLHGYTSAKEHNLAIAYLLADKGFRVMLPDAIHHGERETNLSSQERDLLFWEIVLTSIKEVHMLYQHYQERGLIAETKVGVSGTSMGAITTYGALTQHQWIDAAVCFMGSAYYEKLAQAQLKMLEQKGMALDEKKKQTVLEQLRPFDLTHQLDKLNQRPLLIWHGKQDKVVPFSFSKELYQEAQPHYQQKPEGLSFLVEENAGHKVPRQAILDAVRWFKEHLLKNQIQAS